MENLGESLKSEEIKTSDEKNSKLKLILLILGIIIILVVISVLIILATNSDKDEQKKDDEKKDDEPDCTGNWDLSYKKAEEFINKLNLTEQINLLFGTENMKAHSILVKNESENRYLCVGKIDPFKKGDIDFKGMCLQDGPAGVRFANGSSISWQAGINTAATFNKNLMNEIGKAQGEENKIKGINTFLSPCGNILRSPQGGRIWEAFGDEPYLTGICATELIKGIQSSGVIATMKHFVTNDQETYRKASSSNVDLATLMDIYVEPFYRGVKDGNVGAIMTAYNALNNTYCDENKYLLTDILKNKLGFKGFIMSDWWGVYSDHVNTINSGLDMNMPGGYFPIQNDEEHKYDNYGRNHSFWSKLETSVKENKVEEKRIKDAATRIIASMYYVNQMKNYPSIDLYKESKTEDKKNLQRKAATESQVLLKNEGILPLKNNKNKIISIIGSDAFQQDCIGANDCECKNSTNEVYTGHIPLGYGSGTTKFSYLVTPIEAIKKLAEKYEFSIKESGKLIYTDEERKGIKVHINATEDIENGVKVANESDIAIVFVGAISGEEYIVVENSIGDRADLNVLHNGNELIEKVAEINKNTIVVINSPGPVNIPWKDKVKAIIYSGYPGAESGNAIADVLFGEANPSGHLPFVWGNVEDYAVHIDHLNNLTIIDKESGKTWKDIYRYDGIDSSGLPDKEEGHDKEQYEYKEGLYIGQRWFNKNNKIPIFPFGYGLSYTTFEYNNLQLSMKEDGLYAKFIVKNIGKEIGQAVPMMFLTFPDNIGEYPKYILKGFEKVEIKPNEEKEVTIKSDVHALSYFNIEKDDYIRINEGEIIVNISDNANPSESKLSGKVNAKY